MKEIVELYKRRLLTRGLERRTIRARRGSRRLPRRLTIHLLEDEACDVQVTLIDHKSIDPVQDRFRLRGVHVLGIEAQYQVDSVGGGELVDINA